MTRSERNVRGIRKCLVAGATFLTLVVSAACSAAAPANVLDEIPASTRRARVSVRNQHRHAVRVVAAPEQALYEVGVVRPTSSAAFRLPQVLNGMPVRMWVYCPVEREVFESRLLSWRGGQVVELEVSSLVNMTTVTVRL